MTKATIKAGDILVDTLTKKRTRVFGVHGNKVACVRGRNYGFVRKSSLQSSIKSGKIRIQKKRKKK